MMIDNPSFELGTMLVLSLEILSAKIPNSSQIEDKYRDCFDVSIKNGVFCNALWPIMSQSQFIILSVGTTREREKERVHVYYGTLASNAIYISERRPIFEL